MEAAAHLILILCALVSGDTWPAEERDSQRITLLTRKIGGALVLAHDFDRTNEDVENMVLDCIRSALSMAKETGMRVLTVSQLLGLGR